MGEQVVIIKRVFGRKVAYESVRGDDMQADEMVERAYGLGGWPGLGKVASIHCLDAADIPDGNIFNSAACAVSGDPFTQEHFDAIVSPSE
jgi:hypothetical protein